MRIHDLGLVCSVGLAIACGSSDPPPAMGAGPAFTINSPVEGSSIAGVTSKAGDRDLGSDTTAADGFKVFLAARDRAAGPLRLESGRVASFSTLLTETELTSFEYQQLVINAVSWAARRGE